jgi:hypothetical protein
MSLVSSATTAIATLLGVLLGGWLTMRNQDRLWRRDSARQWRDIRLNAYTNFLAAYRAYVAYASEPTAKITAIPHPRIKGESMPFFDERGTSYKEEFEATTMAARLVSDRTETLVAIRHIVTSARHIAAERAKYAADQVPPEAFDKLWAAQLEFVNASRGELGLPPSPDV